MQVFKFDYIQILDVFDPSLICTPLLQSSPWPRFS